MGQVDDVPAGIGDAAQGGAHPFCCGHDGVIALGCGKYQHRAERFGRTVDLLTGYPGHRERTAGGRFVAERTTGIGRVGLQ